MTITERSWTKTAVGAAILFVMVFPVYWMVNASLQSSGGGVITNWFPAHPDVSGYATALEDQKENLLTSIVVSLGTVAFTLLIAAPAAYALAQVKSRWVTGVLVAILFSQMVPGIVIANALYDAYAAVGLLNTIPGLILADSTSSIPLAVLIIRAFFVGFPKSTIEAAYVDGAGPIKTFWAIVLPVSRNALITAGTLTFLQAWSDFLFALTLTTTPDVRPVTLGIYQYLGAYVSDWGPVMAAAVLAILPALVLLITAQKYLVVDASAGANK